MASSHAPVAEGVLALPDAARSVARVAFLAFDIDGVLVDTSDSYPAAVDAGVRWYARTRLAAEGVPPITPADLPLWKAAGGFNDDWDLAYGVCLYLADRLRRGAWAGSRADLPEFLRAVTARGGGLAAVVELCGGLDADDRSAVARVCMAYYGGEEGCRAMFGFDPDPAPGPGLWRRERALIDRASLLPWRGRIGIYTGRNDGETVFALRAADLEDLFPLDIRHTTDRGYRKPDPAGLLALAAHCGGALLFAGDTPDDLETVRRYRAMATDRGLPPAVFAGILGGAPGPAAEAIFSERGADLIAADSRSLMAYLNA